MITSIYQHHSASSFLRHTWVSKKKQNPSLTVRSWSKFLGMSTHTLLVHLLTGRRKILPSHLNYLKKGLKLDKNEWKYFESLVFLENAKTQKEKEFYLDLAQSVHPDQKIEVLDVQHFQLLSHWIYFAILEMTSLEDFKLDPQWIFKRLGKRVSLHLIHEAIEKLQVLNFLKKEGEKYKKTHQRLTTSARSSEAIRSYHKAILEEAMVAIEAQTPEERILNSFSITVDKKDLPEMAKQITEFRGKFSRMFEKKIGNETYQMNIQLFRLTSEVKKESGYES